MPQVPLAPIMATAALCMGCGGSMRLEVERYASGKLSRIVMYCDKCQYGHEPSMQHVTGQTVKYIAPGASGGK